MKSKDANEYLTAEHALRYLAKADSFPHRADGEVVLLELLPKDATSILDIGTGDGRLLGLALLAMPECVGVGIDFSPTMLSAARARFSGNNNVSFVEHDLTQMLPSLGTFDAVISSFAIHYAENRRKRSLYHEVYTMLKPGGIFCNLEHVTSPTAALHDEFYRVIGTTLESEDPSNRCAGVHEQLEWLDKAGFRDVDCFWKWREFALLSGAKRKNPV